MQITALKKLNMPDTPGVYIFRDQRKRPIYIGRATSLKDRVKSYFRADVIDSRGPRIVDMVTKSRIITWQALDSVLEAILLESELIKKYQPFYNIDERDDKSSQYVVITDETWPRVFLARARDLDQGLKNGTLEYKIMHKFGPYPESGLIKEAMKILRRMFPFKDKKAADPRHEAFYRSIGQSPQGNDDVSRLNYMETIKYLVLFFSGRKSHLKIMLKKKLKSLAAELRFEEAREINRLINAIDHINDISLIKKNLTLQDNKSVDRQNNIQYRIEAYDVAHFGGMENVGAMVVSLGGQLTSTEYRKFKISKNKNDDVAALREMLFRRFNHSEWQYPNLIVIDGNKVQANAAEAILASRRINIPVVGVTKDKHHKAATIIGNPDITNKYKDQIIAINVEAHGVAISYHRQRRNIKSRKGFI